MSTPPTAALVDDDIDRRRRNRPLAAWRKARAVELAIAGRTYDQIAAEVGYANRGTAYKVVQAALRARTVAAVDELRCLEVKTGWTPCRPRSGPPPWPATCQPLRQS